jgi:prepilin-type processing-associated H-X9-DG protein
MADPTRGVGVDQPGGWTYTLLPYIEENAPSTPSFAASEQKEQEMAKADAIRRLMENPVRIYYCPSRRAATVYPVNSTGWNYRNYQPLPQAAKCDYAANAGDHFRGLFTTLKDREQFGLPAEPASKIDNRKYNGVIYHRSRVKTKHLVDGSTKTYLLGEKHLHISRQGTGRFDGGDDENAYVGFDFENCRWGASEEHPRLPPRGDRDDPGQKISEQSFGSAHPSGCNFVMCDGSTRRIAYSIDPAVHRLMTNRKDRRLIDMSSL